MSRRSAMVLRGVCHVAVGALRGCAAVAILMGLVAATVGGGGLALFGIGGGALLAVAAGRLEEMGREWYRG